MWKNGEIAPKEQFLLFSTLFYCIYISNFKSPITLFSTLFYRIYISNFRSQIIHLLNVVVQFIVLLTLSTLICRGTDISLRE